MTPSAEGLVDRVAALAPMIAARSFEAEAQRRPLDEVIDALKATGVFRSFVPERYGGYEIDMQTFVDIGILVSHADPSMGWVTTFYMEHNWLLTMFSEELQDEIFGTQPYVLAPGSVNPSGHAVPQPDGGYLLNGRWQFGTGICHADWVLLSGRIEGAEPPVPRNFLARVDEVEVKDTWHVDGMAATGSRDIIATDVFIPEHRVSLPIPPAFTAGPDAPYLHRIPIAPMLSLTAALPAIGAAKRAVELFQALMFERIQFGTTRTQNNRCPPRSAWRTWWWRSTPPRRSSARRPAASRPTPTGRSRTRSRSSSNNDWRSPTSCGAAVTSCATSSPRAARRCTTSTTSCNASTAMST